MADKTIEFNTTKEFKETPKYNDSVSRSVLGTPYHKNFGSYRYWEVPIVRINKIEKDLINWWMHEGKILQFYYNNNDTDYCNVIIANETSPFEEHASIIYGKYWKGTLILHEWKG
jgi:hypothetical protein